MKPKHFNIFRRREAVANSDPQRECAVANAADVPMEESGGDGWFKISPYGVFPGVSANRQQFFGKPQADAIVAEFDSLRGKLGRMFRGLPVYIGHPDVDPKTYTDHRRLG